jgi:exodeoxyribonuclease VII large subunit
MLVDRKTETKQPSATKGVALSALLNRIKAVINAEISEAVWVRAEIRKLHIPRSGNAFLELEERDANGHAIAHTNALVWSNKLLALQSKFTEGTGGNLQEDMKVLVLVRPDLSPEYGFRLVIEDIDPSYTVGDLLAQMEAIRVKLRTEGVFDKNRMLAAPTNFFRVAVISPFLSAGHGDFRSEADRLHAAGLCEFEYFTALFQGREAPKAIREAMRAMFERHKIRPFDALAIIRGGGASTDLAWLNDLELARWVCRVPIPVFTGIGHERDSTVLDDVAHRPFDTPSKVALHISRTIALNALEALKNLQIIDHKVRRALGRQADAIDGLRDRVAERSWHTLATATSAIEHQSRQVRLAAAHRCREAYVATETARTRVTDGVITSLRGARSMAHHAFEALRDRSRLSIVAWSSRIDSLASEIATKSEARADAARSLVDSTGERLARGTDTAIKTARLRMEHLIEQILGLGPEATLKRGFAIARAADGKLVASAADARGHATLTLQFRDGDIRVENLAFTKDTLP